MMSPKSITIVLLAMSGSFITILAVLGYVIGTNGSASPRARLSRSPDTAIVAPPAPVLRSHPQDTRPRPRDDADGSVLDVPYTPVPFSSNPAVLPPIPEQDAEIELLARVTQRRLQGVENALMRQVEALKKSRDGMLDELAGQIAAMSVEEASASLGPLDDETAALTLQRLGVARRKAVLRTLQEKRRTALEQHLKKLPPR